MKAPYRAMVGEIPTRSAKKLRRRAAMLAGRESTTWSRLRTAELAAMSSPRASRKPGSTRRRGAGLPVVLCQHPGRSTYW